VGVLREAVAARNGWKRIHGAPVYDAPDAAFA